MSLGIWVLTGNGLDEGYWIKDFDVDAYEGRGVATATIDPEEAMRFEDVGAVLEAWKTQSTVRPFRDDGKPNRPLSAFTIQPKELP